MRGTDGGRRTTDDGSRIFGYRESVIGYPRSQAAVRAPVKDLRPGDPGISACRNRPWQGWSDKIKCNLLEMVNWYGECGGRLASWCGAGQKDRLFQPMRFQRIQRAARRVLAGLELEPS